MEPKKKAGETGRNFPHGTTDEGYQSTMLRSTCRYRINLDISWGVDENKSRKILLAGYQLSIASNVNCGGVIGGLMRKNKTMF